MIKAWINGQERTSVSVLDRGLSYGDGLFETILYESGYFFLLDQHLQRLQDGALRLKIPFDTPSFKEELNAFLSYLRLEGLLPDTGIAIVKILLSRGAGGRGYCPSESIKENTRILMLFNGPNYPKAYPEAGIELHLCETPVSINPNLAGLKHLNRLDNVMARSEWNSHEIQEGLMLDGNGNVIEGTMSNLFIVNGNTLITPCLKRAGVSGVMRDFILAEAGKRRVKAQIKETVSLNQLGEADEVFVCNSIFGVWPVIKLDSFSWSVGALTRRIQRWVQESKKNRNG